MGVVETIVEGPLPPSMYGGTVGILGAAIGPPPMGGVLIAACAVVLGVLAGMFVMMRGSDMGPLPTIPSKKG